MDRVERVLQDQVFQVVRPIPFKGIDKFFDVAGLPKEPTLMKEVIDSLVQRIEKRNPTVICALDARGFLFATSVAMNLNLPLVMIRKAGKLPGECVRIAFDKEYESGDVFEIQRGSICESDRVVIIDDILATGGSMRAAFDLVKSMNPHSVEGFCLINLNLPGSHEYMREHSVNVYSLFDVSDWNKRQIGAYSASELSSLLYSISSFFMSGQKSLHFLRTTKYWSMLQKFIDDPVSDVLELPRSVTSAERDQVRQICKHLDLPFKVFGEGTEKYMVVRKPDFSYFAHVEQQSATEQLVVLNAELEHWRNLALSLASELHQLEPKCKICSDQIANSVNRNCGHGICDSCGRSAETCGQCAARIDELIPLPSKRSRS